MNSTECILWILKFSALSLVQCTGQVYCQPLQPSVDVHSPTEKGNAATLRWRSKSIAVKEKIYRKQKMWTMEHCLNFDIWTSWWLPLLIGFESSALSRSSNLRRWINKTQKEKAVAYLDELHSLASRVGRLNAAVSAGAHYFKSAYEQLDCQGKDGILCLLIIPAHFLQA